MPKYYRFRATTPNRKPKQAKIVHRMEKDIDRLENNHLDLKFATMLPTWYLRRTSWREPASGLPRQLAWRSGQLGRPMILFLTQDVTRAMY